MLKHTMLLCGAIFMAVTAVNANDKTEEETTVFVCGSSVEETSPLIALNDDQVIPMLDEIPSPAKEDDQKETTVASLEIQIKETNDGSSIDVILTQKDEDDKEVEKIIEILPIA